MVPRASCKGNHSRVWPFFFFFTLAGGRWLSLWWANPCSDPHPMNFLDTWQSHHMGPTKKKKKRCDRVQIWLKCYLIQWFIHWHMSDSSRLINCTPYKSQQYVIYIQYINQELIARGHVFEFLFPNIVGI